VFCILTGDSKITKTIPTNFWTSVRSGTPQGSPLSPLLFALFVNDLPAQIRTNCLLFADAAKLYHTISSQDDTKLLQEDLTPLCQWSADWNVRDRRVLSTRCVCLTIPSEVGNRNDNSFFIWTDNCLTFRLIGLQTYSVPYILSCSAVCSRQNGKTERSLVEIAKSGKHKFRQNWRFCYY